jgi:putative membrane protein
MVFRWIVTTLGVWAAVEMVPGVHYDRWQTLVLAALVLGLLNVFVKPILALFSAPLIVLSFGLFLILINAALLRWTAEMVPGFTVDSWSSALLASMIISVITLAFAGGHILLARA